VIAWNPKTVCGSVWTSVSPVTVVVPSVKSTDVVACITLKLLATLEDVVKIECESTMGCMWCINSGHNLSIEVINWGVSLGGWSKEGDNGLFRLEVSFATSSVCTPVNCDLL
jgi:hypothetical protein